MSNPESYARIPSTELKKTLEGLQKKINSVCQSQTAANLVQYYNHYLDSRWQKFIRFGRKPLGFIDWIRTKRKEYAQSGLWDGFSCDFYRCLDTCNYDGQITTLERLASYSTDVVLVCDTDTRYLTNAVKKSSEAPTAEAYLEKLEKEYPGFYTATFG